jgi:hypothetical protein
MNASLSFGSTTTVVGSALRCFTGIVFILILLDVAHHYFQFPHHNISAAYLPFETRDQVHVAVPSLPLVLSHGNQ